jgi:hypothetical protein
LERANKSQDRRAVQRPTPANCEVIGLAPIAIATATATATAAATASATTTTTAAITSPTATAARTLFARTSFIDGQRPALEVLLMKHRDGLVCILLGPHFYECKPARTPSRAILHDVDCDNRTRLCKMILQIIFRSCEGQVPNE